MRHIIAIVGTGLALVGQFSPAPKWAEQVSGVTSRLRGLSAASEQVVWASGGNSTIVRTSDAGETWQRLPLPSPDRLDFRDIDAVSESTVYVLSIGPGPASRIFKTTDEGATWTLQFTNDDPNAFYDAMAFWDADHGIAVSDSVAGKFVIILTTDGGKTWTPAPAEGLPPALGGEGFFAASGTNVAVWGKTHAWIGTGAAGRSRVLRTNDAGRTWAVADTPLRGGKTAGIYSIAFRNATHGIVVGGDYQLERDATDNVAVTRDAGATWTLVKGKIGLSGFRSVVAYVPGGNGAAIAVGPLGSDVTKDDGQTWAPLAGPGFDTFSFAPGRPLGWGAGLTGRIGRIRLPVE